MTKHPADEAGCWQRERIAKTLTGKLSVARLPHLPQPRLGILSYRARRMPVDAYRTIAHALNLEAALVRETGVGATAEVLQGLADWVSRGCVPST